MNTTDAGADPQAAAELVEVVDENALPIRLVTRAEMRAQNLWHRSTFVAVVRPDPDPRDDQGLRPTDRLVVHQRASWKDLFPSYWDLAFGGVCGVGEDWGTAAERELSEEAGVSGLDLRLLGRGTYDGDHSRCHAQIYLAAGSMAIEPQDGEAVAVEEVVLGLLTTWVESRSVCPDSLALVVPHLAALVDSVG